MAERWRLKEQTVQTVLHYDMCTCESAVLFLLGQLEEDISGSFMYKGSVTAEICFLG